MHAVNVILTPNYAQQFITLFLRIIQLLNSTYKSTIHKLVISAIIILLSTVTSFWEQQVQNGSN